MPSVTDSVHLDDMSDSDSDSSDGDEEAFISDNVRRDGQDDPPSDSWTFQASSDRGAKVFHGLSKRIVTNQFELLYNPVDDYLLSKVNKEIGHLLHVGRVNLHGHDNSQEVTALDAFACALPPSFLLFFKEWLMTADNKDSAALVTFDDII